MTAARRAALLLAGLVLFAPDGAGAEAQLWTRAGLELEVASDVDVTLDQHLRLDENLTRVAAVMPELGASYQVTSLLSLGGGYRLSYERRRRGDMEFQHRMHLDGETRVDLGDLRLRHRLRVQDRYRTRDGHLVTARNRIGAGWRGFGPWVPRITAGFFHRLGVEDPADPEETRAVHFHKWRATARLRYDFDRQSIAAFYRLEVSRTHPDDPAFHIAGLQYRFAM